MPKTTRDITKSARPKGIGEPVLVRLQPDLAEKIDSWRRVQDKLPSRAEAIRLLVKEGLDVARRKSPKTRKAK
jgi:hypothetical protein